MTVHKDKILSLGPQQNVFFEATWQKIPPFGQYLSMIKKQEMTRRGCKTYFFIVAS